jgi:hypothetical protein
VLCGPHLVLAHVRGDDGIASYQLPLQRGHEMLRQYRLAVFPGTPGSRPRASSRRVPTRDAADLEPARGGNTFCSAVSTWPQSPANPTSTRTSLSMSDAPLEQALHLFLLNRGVLITPFHNMMLVCPDTTDEDVDRLVAALDDALAEFGAV